MLEFLFSDAFINTISHLIAGSSILATITPTKTQIGIINFTSKLLNTLAFNFGNATNKL